jgi:ferrochelatase
MEVLYDLDTEAANIAAELGMKMSRAATVGTHPAFIRMIRDLISARVDAPAYDVCAADCCPPPKRR